MKPIETIYKGYKFRSRLEARWAIYFDFLKIEWKYEHEGFLLENGVTYLPDFYLPKFNGGIYAEIKPDKFTGAEADKCSDLCYESGKPVWMLQDVPDFRAYILLEKLEDSVVWSPATPFFINAERTSRLQTDPPQADFFSYKIPEYLMDEENKQAILAARQARFEHKNNFRQRQ